MTGLSGQPSAIPSSENWLSLKIEYLTREAGRRAPTDSPAAAMPWASHIDNLISGKKLTKSLGKLTLFPFRFAAEDPIPSTTLASSTNRQNPRLSFLSHVYFT